jgi:hypothetical protein
LSNPTTSCFARRRAGDSSHQRRIPRRGEGNRLREHRRAIGAESVEGFLERDDRNAESRLLDEVLLNRVDALRVCLRCERLSLSAADLQSERAVPVVVGRVVEVTGDHEELPELLVEGHSPDEIAHSDINGCTRVAVRCGRLCVGAVRQERGEEQSESAQWRDLTGMGCETIGICHPKKR